MQCVAAAATTIGAASGIRAWLGRLGDRVRPRRLRAATLVLATLAVLGAGAGVGVGGTG